VGQIVLASVEHLLGLGHDRYFPKEVRALVGNLAGVRLARVVSKAFLGRLLFVVEVLLLVWFLFLLDLLFFLFV